jgi:hypothetical protein
MTDSADLLLRRILAGSSLTEGEQVFLATRCLHEARRAGRPQTAPIGQDVVDQIVDTLLWRSHPRTNQGTILRRKAIEALSILREERAIAQLVSHAIGRIRADWEGKPQYDYSGVRQAAVLALLCMPEATVNYVENNAVLAQDEDLKKLIGAWLHRDVGTLGELLDRDNAAVSSVAAFALGTIRNDECLDLLVKRFAGSTEQRKDEDLLWAISDTLCLLNPMKVTECVILPFVDKPPWASYVAYLIGRLGIASLSGVEYAFLRGSLLSPDPYLQGRALRSYATLLARNREDPDSARETERLRELCHDLVLNDYRAADLRGLICVLPELTAGQNSALRHHAIEALRIVGDESSIEVLRQVRHRSEIPEGTSNAPSERSSMNQLSFEIAEEIYWRLTGGLSLETFSPPKPPRQKDTSRTATP